MSVSSIQSQIKVLVASFRDKVADGRLTWKEFEVLVGEFTAAVMLLVAVAKLTGPEKKAWVLEAVGRLCDVLLPYIPTYGLGFFIRPYLKSAALTGASFLIEHIYKDKFK